LACLSLSKDRFDRMRNIKLILEYDGTEFCGWQIQPNARTVQSELKKALQTILHEEISITGAGRTDTGVHASGQVANFFTDAGMEPSKIKAALNGTLPRDIRIITVESVPLQFNARFDAKKREYHYKITRRERAIARDYFWCYKGDLNIDKMRQASQHFIGEHDFQSFCKASPEVTAHICHVETLDWIEEEDFLMMKIIADRFLHNMVRIIMGTMIQIGRGKIDPAQIPHILAAKDRKAAGATAPAKGLFLVKVYYE